MPLSTTRDIVTTAAARDTGVGAFNVLHLETAEAIVTAAGRPVILQISQSCVAYHGALVPLSRAWLP